MSTQHMIDKVLHTYQWNSCLLARLKKNLILEGCFGSRESISNHSAMCLMEDHCI